MSLSIGDKLGPYEILAPIGKGGMGEVFRAHDPRTGRYVAIKTSAEHFNERFDREVRAVAALNHPNICTLFDVGPNYLVMELVEGDAPQGPMPLDEALRIARQIADALEAAHEKGITHRDLKPGNIKVKPDGTVKVLDFGLAKMGPQAGVAPSENSPTLSMAATQAGVILGTAAYMSPEQAKGKEVNSRSDIYAFGLVFYEMLTGLRPHKGDTLQETLASVLRDEPDLSKAPVQVRRLLKRCLEKDPQNRLRHIGDVMSLVDDVPGGAGSQPVAMASAKPKRWLWPAVAAVFFLAATALGVVHFREQSPAVQTVRFQLPPPDQTTIPLGSAFAVSPDGRHLAFAGTGSDKATRLWIRSLDTLEARVIPGAEMGPAPPPMFWSPDSRFVVFQDGGKLKKVDIAGGPPQTLCEVTGFVVSGSWNGDGQIILGNNVQGKNGGALMRVPSTGGDCSPLTKMDPPGMGYHSFPAFLPDGRHFLYSRTGVNSGIYVGSIDVKPEEQNTQRLLATPFVGGYVPPSGSTPGQVLFVREATLMAQAFDDQKLELTGEAVPVAEQLGSFLAFSFFSASANGVLVYRTGPSQAVSQLSWLDRQGKHLESVGDPGLYNSVALSPDQMYAMVTRGDGDLWLMDLKRNVTTRFTFGRGRSQSPVWSADGTQIIFASDRDGGVLNLYRKLASGAKEEELLLKSSDNKLPTSWSADGRFLLYTAQDPKAGSDVWLLPLEAGSKAGEPRAFVRTEFAERRARFSPDSRWVAYNSNESGREEIYVRPFSPSSAGDASEGGKWLISSGALSGPSWLGGGKELAYVASNFMVTAIDVSTTPVFRPGSPRPLYPWPGGIAGSGDIGADGRALATVSASPGAPAPFTVVVNWVEGLKK